MLFFSCASTPLIPRKTPFFAQDSGKTPVESAVAPITNAGLNELAGLKSLRSLSLTGTKVTTAGIAELQKSLPNTKIVRYEE